MGIVEQTGAEFWRGTPHTTSYLRPEIFAAVEYSNQVMFDASKALPAFWAATAYHPPDTALGGCWQYHIAKQQMFYDWMSENPRVQKCFTALMKGYTSQRDSWVDLYPTEWIMGDAEGGEGAVVVDIGGYFFLLFSLRFSSAIIVGEGIGVG